MFRSPNLAGVARMLVSRERLAITGTLPPPLGIKRDKYRRIFPSRGKTGPETGNFVLICKIFVTDSPTVAEH
ncbi:hypothetical protein M4578_17400 [Salipiger sp. P9]|nr:hypothetical protein [Salipiger pentaromativorans]